MLNFNQLRVFYEVAKAQSIKEASKRLCVSEPAVSTAIKSFESSCDLILFKRIGRKLILTEAGYTILNSCQEVFELEKKIEEEIIALRELRSGIVKIGTSKTYARYLMPPLLKSFYSRYPNLKIILNEGTSLQIGESILKGQNELAIIAKVGKLEAIEFIPFKNEEVVLFASIDHPFSKKGGILFKELTNQPMIMRDEGSGTRKIIEEAFARHSVNPLIILETGNSECIKDMVANGKGLSFLVHSSVKEDIEKGRLARIPIIDERLYLPIYIAFVKNQPLSHAGKAFFSFLVGEKKL